MLKLTLVTVGKIKESFFREAIAEYSKRISRFAHLQVLEAADEKTPDGASAAEEDKIRETEGKRILQKIPDGAYVITLEIEGRQMDSVSLSRLIDTREREGKSHLVFVIGGSLGLSPDVIRRADYHLSFGPMTFPHQLMRVMLMEQLYRAFKIQAGQPYHK
ncbi:MAG: 23S rRNA (pseudouridine(1915)-N(3))-methyltransferase RlmH [Firmicutes bacterium]|nr:23S rRNA (pseudouridine(1915)-N(3))-methyltransferase RlmH [Bacillota bacterium]